MTRKWPKVDGRSKKQKYYTLLLIPNNENSMRKWRIPVVLIPLMAVFSLFGLGCMLFFAYGYFTFQGEVESLKALKTINEYQAKQIDELKQQAQAMKVKLHTLDELDRKVRSMVGLEAVVQEEDGLSGSGGSLEPLNLEQANQNYPTVDIRWDELKQRITAFNASRNSAGGVEQDLQLMREIAENYEELQEKAEKKAMEMERLVVEVEERLEYLAKIPDLWPVEGRITSSFGWRKNPITNRGKEYHEGIDIAARAGTPVKAAAEGKVILAGYRAGWGRVVVIDHGNGYQTQYAHNSSLLVKVGDQVSKGQVIAKVGSTGRSTGSHLDFRIVKDGQYIDPLTILKH